LPDWQYPIVCDLTSGKVNYDNFDGLWGEQAQLERFLQAYLVEKTRLEARKKWHTAVEQALPNGYIAVDIQVGGAA
jgi:hypothetical protein